MAYVCIIRRLDCKLSSIFCSSSFLLANVDLQPEESDTLPLITLKKNDREASAVIVPNWRFVRFVAKKYLFVVAAGFLVATAANAQDKNKPAIKVGEADLYPSVRLDYLSIDNIFRSELAPVEATGVRVAPSAILVANRRGLELKAGYSGAFGSFSEDEINYNDHHVFGSVDAIFSSRKRGTADVYFKLNHEEFGVGLSRTGDEQVESFDSGFSGSFTYGADTARFNATTGFLVESTSYQNRRELTLGRDYIELTPFGQLSYRLSVDTRALLEIRLRNLDFDSDSLDRAEAQVLTGLSFRGTGKSGGEAKIGIALSDYSDSRINDVSVLTANVGLFYIPSENSRIDIEYTREFNNEDLIDVASADATQTIDDTAEITWKHQWSGFVRSTATLELVNQDRDCPETGNQHFTGGLELSFLTRKWLEIGAGFSSSSYSEDDCGVDGESGSDYNLQELALFTRITL